MYFTTSWQFHKTQLFKFIPNEFVGLASAVVFLITTDSPNKDSFLTIPLSKT